MEICILHLYLVALADLRSELRVLLRGILNINYVTNLALSWGPRSPSHPPPGNSPASRHTAGTDRSRSRPRTPRSYYHYRGLGGLGVQIKTMRLVQIQYLVDTQHSPVVHRTKYRDRE